MSFVATAIIGGAVIGAVSSDKAASKAAKGQKKGRQEARRQFDLNREDLRVGREVGDSALQRLDRLQSGDFSDFFTSPNFEFVRDEGLRGIENRFSASGGSLSGNALRRLTEFNSGLASGEFNNFANRDLNIAGLGQNAINTGVASGNQLSGNIQNSFANQGNARASGVAGVNDAVQGGLANFLFAQGAGFLGRPPITTAPRPRPGIGGI